jgi:hypothetical protein
VLRPLRSFAKPKQDSVQAMDYLEVQRQSDGPPLSTRNAYLKSGFIASFTPALIDTLVNEVSLTGPLSLGTLQCGGAIAEVAPTATAIAHRSEQHQLVAHATWVDNADNDRNRALLHALWDKLKPHTTGFYVNLNEPDQKAVDDNYGPNHARLAAIKKRYDPGNLFRLNANIKPA